MYEFNQIYGNENIIKSLKNSIINNTISNAYIFDGAEKTGKETIAKCFAKLLQCKKNNQNPCNECSSCLSFDNGNNPDVIFLKSEKKTIGVEEIREKIIKNTNIKPFNNKYKIFIIKDAHKMTTQAQNAILKTLEEPPPYTVFLLLSKNYNLFLPTILSRCILFKIKPISTYLIKEFLKNQSFEFDRNNIDIYANYSLGSIGKAIEIATSKHFFELRKFTLNEIYNLQNSDLIQMYNSINKLEEYKDNIQQILDIFLLTYRDAIIYKSTNSFEKVIQKDTNEIIQKLSKFSYKNLIKKINAILNSKNFLNQNINFYMNMECLFLKLKEK